jgi:ABC-2 type transport system permease protein
MSHWKCAKANPSLSSSYLLVFKRGNPAKWFVLGITSIVGGTLFPVSILPDWLQVIARLNPVTYALDATLLLFAAILLPLSLSAFAWAVRRTKTTGTLTHS